MAPEVVDVAVIGAGISGLRAASLLQRTGISAVVLEARPRVGGKILTTDREPGMSIRQEYGAAWINDTTQDRIWALVKEFRLTPVISNSEGKVVAQDFSGSCVEFKYGDTPEYPSDLDSVACVALRDLIEKITTQDDGPLQSRASRKELDAISFEAWLAKVTNHNERACATGKVWTHAIIGCDPGEVSALFFLDYVRSGLGLMSIRSDKSDGGQYMRIAEGISSFPERLAQQLKPGSLRLACPVKSIKKMPGSDLTCVMSSTGEVCLAKRVIISVASPVYRTIDFSPRLSLAKRAYVNSTRYSGYVKCLAVFKEPFWVANGYCGLAQSFTGPVSVFRDTSVERGNNKDYALTCFICGTYARSWSALSAEQQHELLLQQISLLFNKGRDVTPLFITALQSSWADEQYNGWGCPIPTLGPGIFNECFEAFAAPEGNLHFIGNETATRWRGYMDGALRTAERGVAEVTLALSKQKAAL